MSRSFCVHRSLVSLWVGHIGLVFQIWWESGEFRGYVLIYNKKCVFILISDTTPKTLGISCDESNKVSFVMLVWFWKAPRYSQDGVGHQRNQSWDWRAETFSRTLLTSGERGVRGWTHCQRPVIYNQTRLCEESSIQDPKDRVQRASRLVNMWRFGGVVIAEVMEAPILSHTLPYSWGLMLSSRSVRTEFIAGHPAGVRLLLDGVGKPTPHVRLGTRSLGLSKMELQIGGGIRILSQTFGTELCVRWSLTGGRSGCP